MKHILVFPVLESMDWSKVRIMDSSKSSIKKKKKEKDPEELKTQSYSEEEINI